jgi:hypothetical protein
MEKRRFMEAIKNPPPELYLSIEQHENELDRCDAIAFERDDKNNIGEIVAINIETQKDVKAGCCTDRNKEGQVYRRMVAPFAFGAYWLEIVCEEASRPKLEELKNKLPLWLRQQIRPFTSYS